MADVNSPMTYTSLVLFNAGVSTEEALRIIRCTFPSVTREDVNRWHQYFIKNGVPFPVRYQENVEDQEDFQILRITADQESEEGQPLDGYEEVEQPEKSLLHYPKEILSKIAENLTATDVISLKKVSWYTLEKVNVDRVYSMIHIHLDDEKAKVLALGLNDKRSCQTFSRGKRSHDDEAKKGRQEGPRYEYVDDAVKALKKILGQPEVSIKKFLITFDDSKAGGIEGLKKYYLEEVEKAMGELQKSVNVERFETALCSSVKLQDFLVKLQPGCLSYVTWSDSEIGIDMDEIKSLPHLDHFVVFNLTA